MSETVATKNGVATAACKLIEAGMVPVLVYPRDKRPIGDGWPDIRYTVAEATEGFTADHNIGINLHASGVADVDLDSPQARSLAAVFLPPTGMIWGRASTPRAHWAYRLTGGPDEGESKYHGVLKQEGKKDGALLLELRTRAGNQSVIPPSIHKDTGERITWDDSGIPAEIDIEDLRAAVGRLAAASMIATVWTETRRHDLALYLPGFLLKSGAEPDHVTMLLEAVVDAFDDAQEKTDRLRAISDTIENFEGGENVAGARKLGAILGPDAKEFMSKLLKWLGLTGMSRLPNDKRPTIIVNGRDWAEISEEVFGHVVHLNQDDLQTRVFQRGTHLARVRITDEGPIIEKYTENALAGYLVRHLRWVKVTRNGLAPVQPSAFVVKDLVVRPSWPGLPVLRDMVELPIFLKDGTLVSAPGYHRDSGIWMQASGLALSPAGDAPDEPTRRAALALLDDIFFDFPFNDAASRAHALAALLLPFVRELIEGPTPLHLFDAPTPGTGKGLLMNVLSLIHTGRAAATVSAPTDDDEWRKRITAMLFRGQKQIVLDNLPQAKSVTSASLASVLTSTHWNDRILGETQMTPLLPNRALWVATGNNIELSNELARRSVLTRLMPTVERPSSRPLSDFRHPALEQYVLAIRSFLVWACLILVRSWIAANQPRVQTAMGSFVEWAQIMGGLLHHHGIEGFLGNQEDLFDRGDGEMAPWRPFIKTWAETYGTKPVRVRDLRRLAESQDLLAEVMGEGSERNQQTLLGASLTRYADRIVAGHKIVRKTADFRPGFALEKVSEG